MLISAPLVFLPCTSPLFLTCTALGGELVPHDFLALWSEKQASHLQGTREWAFEEVMTWLNNPSEEEASKLLCYLGGGGTGKSVRRT